MGKRIQPPPPEPPRETTTKTKRGEKTTEREIYEAVTTPVTKASELVQIVLTLPKAHVRVLDTEAGALNQRRYQFMELLLLSQLGQAVVTRPSYMPSYHFTRAEVTTTERVLIYMRPAVKRLFTEHLQRHGLRSSSWAAMAIRDWANLTEALQTAK